ncbi:MAG: hypothetical protein QXN56_04945 [Candidatus Hadarchaeum sp.]
MRVGERWFGKFLVRAMAALSAVVYVFLIMWSYKYAVVPRYSYMGYVFYEKDALNYLMVYLFAFLGALLLPERIKTPSQLIGTLLFIFVYVPALAVSTMSLDLMEQQFIELYLSLFFALAAFFVLIQIPLPRKEFPCLAISKNLWVYILIKLSLLFFAYLIIRFGVNTPPSILDPYDVRLAARDYGAFAGYILRLLGNVLGPTVFIAGLVSRRTLWTLIGLLIVLGVYSFDGTKSTLLMPMMIVFIWTALKLATGRPGLLVAGFAIFFGVLSWMDEILGGTIIGSMFVRRLVITPGLLTGFYYEYFSNHPPFIWSHSILRFFLDSPYLATPPFVIGLEYFGSDTVSANANLWADGFANAGLSGPLLTSVLAAFFFRFVDWLAMGRSTLGMLIWVAPSFALINSALLTAILTHGLFATMLLLITVPRRFCRGD